MLTYIKKNLIIAALEDSLLTGKKAAGISTLAEMDTLLAALRSRLNADPDAVADKSIWQMYARMNALKFPDVSNIWWAFNDLSMFDSVETETVGWSNVTGKPATFPPKPHSHDYASITEKPTTFEPSAHAHDYASITEKPTTFEPSAHAHDYASITEKPTTFEPSEHSHAYSDITGKPTTFAPSEHSHAYSDITGKPSAFAPSAHSHAVTTSVYYVGNGEASRVLTLSAAIMPTAILLMRNDAGLMYYWAPMFGSTLGSNTHVISNAISVAAGTVTLTSTNGNDNGNGFTLLAWGNAS